MPKHSKLRIADVHRIRELYEAGTLLEVIADSFGLTASYVSRIARRKMLAAVAAGPKPVARQVHPKRRRSRYVPAVGAARCLNAVEAREVEPSR